MDSLIACGKKYNIIKLLGRDKGGYAYLAETEGRQAVVKKIHHEPCRYYSFGNIIEAEKRPEAAGVRNRGRAGSHDRKMVPGRTGMNPQDIGGCFNGVKDIA